MVALVYFLAFHVIAKPIIFYLGTFEVILVMEIARATNGAPLVHRTRLKNI